MKQPYIDPTNGEEYYVPEPIGKQPGFEKPKPRLVPDVENIVAITGHRPEKIKNEAFVRGIIRQVLEQRKVGCLIAGLAAGVDLWAAEDAIKLGIPVVSARPWTHHQPRKDDRRLYDYVLSNSWRIVDIVRTYRDEKDKKAPMPYPGPHVYQMRNEWMVDNAHKVFAVWDGTEGGTANCYNYALEKKKRILRYDINQAVFVLVDEEGKTYSQ